MEKLVAYVPSLDPPILTGHLVWHSEKVIHPKNQVDWTSFGTFILRKRTIYYGNNSCYPNKSYPIMWQWLSLFDQPDFCLYDLLRGSCKLNNLDH